MQKNDSDNRTERRRGCRYWLNLSIVAVVALILFGIIGYDAMGVYMRTEPVLRPVSCKTPADHDLAYEEVSLDSCDDTTLAGWYIPPQNGAAVIMLHGYGGTRMQLLSQAAMLGDAGYGVLLYDMRGHGESSPVMRSFGWGDVGDVYNAWDWLAARTEVDEGRISLYGFSVGGQVALRAAAFSTKIAAVVADGPSLATGKDIPRLTSLSERLTGLGNHIVFQGIAWRTGQRQPLSVVEVIGDIAPRPLLLIATGGEEGIEQRLVQNYFAEAGEPKELWSIPDVGHGGGARAHAREYARRLVNFYDQAPALSAADSGP